jgi:glycosyltransferase involved in cell wall biosynthesis
MNLKQSERFERPVKVYILTSNHRAVAVRIFHKEAISLAKCGYEVHIWGKHSSDALIENVFIHSVSANTKGLIRKIISSPRFLARVLFEKADIYHFHDPDLIFCGLVLSILGKKVIMDVHEDFKLSIVEKRDRLPKIFRYPIVFFFDFLEKKASKFFSGIVVVSEEIQKKFLIHNPNTVLVRNFPINYPFIEKQKNTNFTFEIVYAGSIDTSRGCWQILSAFDLFKRRYSQAKLKIIGPFQNRNLEEEFKRKALQLGSVDIKGYLPWDVVLEEQRKADVGLVISTFQKHNREKVYPVKLFEYLSLGLPVIISKKPYWETLLNEGKFGIMVDADDPVDIANAMYRLAVDPTLRTQMGQSGKKMIQENYSWDKEFEKMKMLYKKILAV